VSEINDLIAIHARRAFDQGVKTENNRIVQLLTPLSKCDPDLCGPDGSAHYGDDCDAAAHAYTLWLIQQNPENPIQENMHERANNSSKGDDSIPEMAKTARAHELFMDGMLAAFDPIMEKVNDFLSYSQFAYRIGERSNENGVMTNEELRRVKDVWNLMLVIRDSVEDEFFMAQDKARFEREREKLRNELH
jgi:hypothetical protein